MESITNFYQKKFTVISQGQIENSDNPCTGISYYALTNIKTLIDLFNSEKETEYYQLYESLIKSGINRKNSNPNIPKEGEYLDENTIKKDFKEIFDKISFSYCYDNNDLIDFIKNLDNNSTCIVSRGSATFVFVKFNSEEYLVIDSHNMYHGILSFKNLIKYINFDNLIIGNVEVGFFKI